MRKISIILAITVLVLLLCACSNKTSESASAQPTAEVVATVAPAEQTPQSVEQTPAPAAVETVIVTPEPTPTLEIVYVTPAPTNNITIVPAPDSAQQQTVPSATAYAGVISNYSNALLNSWDAQTCINNGVNYLVAAYAEYNPHGLGYCFKDVDGNGIEELIIGGGDQIIAMYSLSGSTPVQVIDAGERSAYYLEPDGVIVNSGSSSAFSHCYGLYKLQGTSLKLSGAIIADYSVNEAEPWFYSETSAWDISNAQKVSNSKAESWIQAYESNYVYLPYNQFY